MVHKLRRLHGEGWKDVLIIQLVATNEVKLSRSACLFGQLYHLAYVLLLPYSRSFECVGGLENA